MENNINVNNQNTYQQQPPQMGQQMMPPMGRIPMRQRIRNASQQVFASYFPHQYSSPAIIAYFIGLFGVAVLASSANMVMEWQWWVFGIVEVLGFFLISTNLSKKWERISPKAFEKKLFVAGFGIRAVAVIFLYWFFEPFHNSHKQLTHIF